MSWNGRSGVKLLLFCLAVMTAFPANPQQDSATEVARLKQQVEEAYQKGDFQAALKAAGEVRAWTEYQDGEALYRIAGLHCRLGQNEEAYAKLQEAFDRGYFDLSKLRQDPDFEALRAEDRFRSMVRKKWATQYIAMLERPERASFQKPDQVMAALAFKPGEKVADVGAGSGYFTIPVARAVGPGAEVLAADIRQEMLDYLKKRLETEKVSNVKLLLVQPDDPLLPPGGLDTILMVDTFHYIKDGAAYAKKLRAGLAPGGRVVIIDYTPKPFEERPWGPPPEQQVSREKMDEMLAAGGLIPAKVHTFLPEQYFVEYQPRPE